MSERTVTAALIIIGNEILSGRTQDANLAFLAQELNEIGIQIREVAHRARRRGRHRRGGQRLPGQARPRVHHRRHRPDPRRHHLGQRRQGVRPPFGLHPEAERRLRAYYPPEKLNDARLKMAQTPEGAELIDNPVSVAPGFTIGNVHVLPACPRSCRRCSPA